MTTCSLSSSSTTNLFSPTNFDSPSLSTISTSTSTTLSTSAASASSFSPSLSTSTIGLSSPSLYTTQNDLLRTNLISFYQNNPQHMDKMVQIVSGASKISLRIVDWFATNYAKKNFTLYTMKDEITGNTRRFKVYEDYKLKLKSYSKKRFDPFCRHQRITIPYKDDGTFIETTIGQLNFFKWTLENNVIRYIEDNYYLIEKDMNTRNSTSKRKDKNYDTKTRKQREELSVSAVKSILREDVEIVMQFH